MKFGGTLDQVAWAAQYVSATEHPLEQDTQTCVKEDQREASPA